MLNLNLHYIHVYRDGLDMAFSKNQNQLMLWGKYLLNRPVARTAADSLDYWNRSHQHVLKLKVKHPGKIHFISFDKLCCCTAEELEKLYGFLHINANAAQSEKINKAISPPSSIGRGMDEDLNQFSHELLNSYNHTMEALRDTAPIYYL